MEDIIGKNHQVLKKVKQKRATATATATAKVKENYLVKRNHQQKKP